MRRLLAAVFAVLFLFGASFAEEYWDTTTLVVTANRLNGRMQPSKKSQVVAFFDKGDKLIAYEWSEKHHWIEVEGGENGTCWVCWEYVTERTEPFTVWNNWGTKIKIRKEPFGRVVGYLKNDAEVVIDRVVLGWGHCSKGWIDLKYVTEED